MFLSHRRFRNALGHFVLPNVAAFVFLSCCLASDANAQKQLDNSADSKKCIIVELYITDQQSASKNALAAATRLAESRQGIRLVTRSITNNEKAQERLKKIARYFRFDEKTTPVIYCCNQVIRSGASEKDFQRQLNAALRMEVFTRRGCKRCAKAKLYLPGLSQQYPGIEIVYRELLDDFAARDDLNELVRKHRTAAASTPVFHFCNKLIVGFNTPDTTGVRIEKALGRWTSKCPAKQQPTKKADQSLHPSTAAQEVAGQAPF